MFGYWKRTPLESQLVIPTLIANRLIFNDLENTTFWKEALFYVHMASLCLLEVLHIAYLFNKDVDIVEFATAEETITSTMEALLRLVALRVYQQQYKKLYSKMTTTFWPTQAFDTTEKVDAQFSKTVNMFSHINTASAFITMFVLLCLPIIHGVRDFPFKIWVPWDKLYECPYFQIITAWQWVTNFWTVLFSILCYDYIFVMFTAATICQLKMLQRAIKFSNAENVISFLETKVGPTICSAKNEEERCLMLLKVCIKHHVALTEFINNIYATYSLPFLAQFAGTFNALCFSGYILVSVEIDDTITVLHIITYILVHVVEIFILLKTAQEIYIQYQLVADAAFESYWYKFPYPRLRKHLILVMRHAQHPPVFTAGGFVTCNLPGLLNIFKWSFSVITLLRKFEK